MSSDGYNGWTNYETWAVALWLGNDEGSASYWQEQAEDCVSRYGKDTATSKLAGMLKDEICDGEFAPDLGASLYADLLGAALSEVDWYEIAEHYVADVEEEEEEA